MSRIPSLEFTLSVMKSAREKDGLMSIWTEDVQAVETAKSEIDRLREELNAVHMAKFNYEEQVASLRVQLASARKAAIEECAKVAEAEAQEFLSPEYAANQPFGSTCERFASGEVAKAIRALLTDDLREVSK